MVPLSRLYAHRPHYRQISGIFVAGVHFVARYGIRVYIACNLLSYLTSYISYIS